jgi:hypothetical protein
MAWLEVKQFFNDCLKNILRHNLYFELIFAAPRKLFSHSRRRNDFLLCSLAPSFRHMLFVSEWRIYVDVDGRKERVETSPYRSQSRSLISIDAWKFSDLLARGLRAKKKTHNWWDFYETSNSLERFRLHRCIGGVFKMIHESSRWLKMETSGFWPRMIEENSLHYWVLGDFECCPRFNQVNELNILLISSFAFYL